MAKQRATLRGRGADILFGEPQAVEVEPLSSEPVPTDAEPEARIAGEEPAIEQVPDWEDEPVPSLPEELAFLLDEPDLVRALEEEALASGPKSGFVKVELDVADMGSPDLEVDMAYSEAAFAIQEQVEPEAELPDSTPEEPVAETSVEAPIFEPPAPEIGDVVNGVLPPRPQGVYFEATQDEIAPHDIQEPEDKVEPIELPDRELTDEERAQILAWLGDERLADLEISIDEAYAKVRSTVANNEDITTDCLNKLLQARDIVVRRDAGKLAQAENYVESVRARLERAVDSDAAAKKYQWWIFMWGLFWCGIFLTLLILLNESWFQELLGPMRLQTTLVNMEVFLSTMIWGGIGGCVAVLYSLLKHVGRRDFDRHYSLSYIGKPVLGLIIGATIYMVFSLVVRTLGILPFNLEGIEGVAAPAVAPGAMYLMAWFGGFKENRIFDLMDRTMKRLFSGDETS